MEIVGIVSLILALGAVIGRAIYERSKGKSEAQESEASAADVLTSTAIKLLEPLDRRITELEKESAFMQARLHEKDKEIAALKQKRDYRISELQRQLTDARARIKVLEELCLKRGVDIDV